MRSKKIIKGTLSTNLPFFCHRSTYYVKLKMLIRGFNILNFNSKKFQWQKKLKLAGIKERRAHQKDILLHIHP